MLFRVADYEHKWWNRELILKCKLQCYVKPMKNPLGVSPKGNQGTTGGKEKILLTSVGIEPTTSGLDLPLLSHFSFPLLGLKPSGFSWVSHSTKIYTSELILCSTICVHSATRHNIHMLREADCHQSESQWKRTHMNWFHLQYTEY